MHKDGIVLSKDGIVLSKDGFGACHPLDQGSMGNSEISKCSYESADCSHNGKKNHREKWE